MSMTYIFGFKYLEKAKGQTFNMTATVIFLPYATFSLSEIKNDIASYFQNNSQSDRIFVISGEYASLKAKEVFIDNCDLAFRGIPRRSETHLRESLSLLSFDQEGNLKIEYSPRKAIPNDFITKYVNEGLQKIFLSRGGLNASEGTHHFVFPSGKHCDRFLRTGNVLLHSCEIYFIAFSLLRHLKPQLHTKIYCDTSSINSIALALLSLKQKFGFLGTELEIPITSFSSYAGLYNNEFSYTADCLLIISASTSANILKYIQANHQFVKRENIVVLFYLGEEASVRDLRGQILCDLTKSSNNPSGIPLYPTYQQKECLFCKRGSFPIEISGDVFLLEKPRVDGRILLASDADRNLSSFVEQFRVRRDSRGILKVNYKEGKGGKYDVFIDYLEILEGFKHQLYQKYQEKLDAYISQFIPSNTKYLVHLGDKSSVALAQYILNQIGDNYSIDRIPIILSIDELSTVQNIKGAVVVVASCVANGKQLLFCSRALRKYENLRVVYFVGLSRMQSKEEFDFLRSNLKFGSFGPESSIFVEIQSIYCDNRNQRNSWLDEIDFIKEALDFFVDSGYAREEISFLTGRIDELESGQGSDRRGLSNSLFLPSLVDQAMPRLELRKNFAFFDFHDYAEDISQADVYFTISNVLNRIRTVEKDGKKFSQSPYVRNLIDPGNFSRFNDGIIQASILRAAVPEELAYDVSEKMSLEMSQLVLSILENSKEDQGEAALEFLLAVGTKKLKLKEKHLQNVVSALEDKNLPDLLRSMIDFVCLKFQLKS
jgi:hypothetical protein